MEPNIAMIEWREKQDNEMEFYILVCISLPVAPREKLISTHFKDHEIL